MLCSCACAVAAGVLNCPNGIELVNTGNVMLTNLSATAYTRSAAAPSCVLAPGESWLTEVR